MENISVKGFDTSENATIVEISVIHTNTRVYKESESSTSQIISNKLKGNLKGTCCAMNIWCHPGTFKIPRMTSFMFPILCDCDISQKQFRNSAAMIPRLNIMFPLLTQETVDGLEILLKMDTEYRELLIEDLYYLESGSLITYTKRIMNVLFSIDILDNYSFKSQKVNESTKKSFSELRICQVIIEAVRKHDKYKGECCDIELKIKAYLTQIWYHLKFRRKVEELNFSKET